MKRLNAYTEAERLRGAWVAQYGARMPEEADRLSRLGARPSPEAVDQCFADFPTSVGRGNRVTRTFDCFECEGTFEEVVLLGDPNDDYDSKYAQVCARCLLKALQLLEE